MNDQVTKPGPSAASGPEGAGTGPPHLNALVTAVCAPATSLCGADGQIRVGGAQGLYVQDYRVLSELVLTVDRKEPVPLGHHLAGGAVNEFRGAVFGAGNRGPDPTVFVHRSRALGPSGMVESLTFESYAGATATLRVELRSQCDLAEMSAVKGRAPTSAEPAAASQDGLVWEFPGRCSVHLAALPHPSTTDAKSGLVAWDLHVHAGRPVTLELTVTMQTLGAAVVFASAPRGHPVSFAVPDMAESDNRLRRFVEVSIADLEQLRMVLTSDADETFLAAGAPWYLALFGRDSIWAARMLLPLSTDLAMGTLRSLAHLQGRAYDPGTGEQPGKILHEVRRAGLPGLPGRQPTSRPPGNHDVTRPPVYYGSVDATLLWVCLLHDAWRRGVPESAIEPLLGTMQRCLSWMSEHGRGPSGFVSYIDESGKGLANQGWKDSWDAVQFRDGRRAQAPIALCEVQGYAFEAATAGGELLDAFGLEEADRWRDFGAAMQERFRCSFWVEDADGPYPAMAIQSDGAAVDSLSSNIGHLLATGILNNEETDLVARRLGGPDLNCGFGLRTLAASSAGFNPVSYHCGSVWPHDTAIAITGLARDPRPAAHDAAISLIDGLLNAAEGFEYRLPELYAGHSRAEVLAPLAYPDACRPQAWAAAASIAIMAALVEMKSKNLGAARDIGAGPRHQS
jgi:glycogen debranching enzyme